MGADTRASNEILPFPNHSHFFISRKDSFPARIIIRNAENEAVTSFLKKNNISFSSNDKNSILIRGRKDIIKLGIAIDAFTRAAFQSGKSHPEDSENADLAKNILHTLFGAWVQSLHAQYPTAGSGNDNSEVKKAMESALKPKPYKDDCSEMDSSNLVATLIDVHNNKQAQGRH